MNIEVLVSTMQQNDFSLVERMNIKSNALIINQCDQNKYIEVEKENGNIRMISTTDRGLSKSRNLALDNSKADICIVADDDLIYEYNYLNIVRQAYKDYPAADIIAFSVPSTNQNRPTSELKEGKVDFLHSMKLASFQITFKRQTFIENNIRFNELFGAGAKYTCGEENILLTEALKKDLKIFYVEKNCNS